MLKIAVGDHIFLRVLSIKGVKRFGLKENIASRYIGPLQILEWTSAVAYQLALPLAWTEVHNIFHISIL